MGQSLSQLYIHLTFGTKDRLPFLKEEFHEKIHSYIGGSLKNLESSALIINSVADHIHILFRLSKNHSLAKVIEEIKKSSSKFIKTIDPGLNQFAWQTGYGAFSVSSTKVEIVEKYIRNQKQHHMKQTYQKEVEQFLKEYDIIDYKAEYYWR
jgi:putative transposase